MGKEIDPFGGIIDSFGEFFDSVGEILDRVRGLPKSNPPIPHKREQQTRVDNKIWEYVQFRDYLLRSRSITGTLLPLAEHPGLIRMSDDWKAIFRQLDEKNNTGTEFLHLIGIKYFPAKLLLQAYPVKGRSTEVPTEIIEKFRREAILKNIFDHSIGSIHNHPFVGYENLLPPAFSPPDLFNQVKENPSWTVGMVVGGHRVAMALNTLETRNFIHLTKNVSHVDFAKHWYRFTVYGPEMNKSIAQQHALALYITDQIDGDFRRVYPSYESTA